MRSSTELHIKRDYSRKLSCLQYTLGRYGVMKSIRSGVHSARNVIEASQHSHLLRKRATSRDNNAKIEHFSVSASNFLRYSIARYRTASASDSDMIDHVQN